MELTGKKSTVSVRANFITNYLIAITVWNHTDTLVAWLIRKIRRNIRRWCWRFYLLIEHIFLGQTHFRAVKIESNVAVEI